MGFLSSLWLRRAKLQLHGLYRQSLERLSSHMCGPGLPLMDCQVCEQLSHCAEPSACLQTRVRWSFSLSKLHGAAFIPRSCRLPQLQLCIPSELFFLEQSWGRCLMQCSALKGCEAGVCGGRVVCHVCSALWTLLLFWLLPLNCLHW